MVTGEWWMDGGWREGDKHRIRIDKLIHCVQRTKVSRYLVQVGFLRPFRKLGIATQMPQFVASFAYNLQFIV
jgi:hypothetical protein